PVAAIRSAVVVCATPLALVSVVGDALARLINPAISSCGQVFRMILPAETLRPVVLERASTIQARASTLTLCSCTAAGSARSGIGVGAFIGAPLDLRSISRRCLHGLVAPDETRPLIIF